MSASYQVFARKYRPKTFDDVLGQDHVVRTLRNAIEQDRLAHAYLLCGPRGTGKTSLARIFAKALNCPGGPSASFDPEDPLCVEIAEGRSLDVLEIDGASNNGVDQVRDLRDSVKFAPAACKYKIYYIDEVHMLSTAAFNALLKTLEEPPPHVKFIFATTEAQKILPTIVSRCQRFDLRRIPAEIIAGHLRSIAELEGLQLSEAAAYAVARGADGGMRDAQSMLDQLVAFCGERIEEESVLEIFGFSSAESVAGLAELILRGKTSEALEEIHRHYEAGRDLTRLLGDIIGHLRNVLVVKVDPRAEAGELSPAVREMVEGQGALVETSRLIGLIDLMAETEARMKAAPNKRLHLEIGVIKAIQMLGETSLDEVIEMISSAATVAGGLPPGSGAEPVESAPRATAPLREGGAAVPAPTSGSSPSSDAADASAGAESGGGGEAETVAPRSGEPRRSAPGELSGEALWHEARRDLVEEKPLFEAWLGAASFLRHDGGELVIGFSTEQRFFRESLVRYETEIEERVAALAGAPVRLRIEVCDTVAPVEFAPDPGDAEDSAADSSPSPPSGGGEAPESAPAPGSKAGGAGADFQDDPLIREALKEFEARIVES